MSRTAGKRRERTNSAILAELTIDSVPHCIERTHRWLLDHQHADGHWCAELEGDTILESEYLLLLAFLGQEKTDRARRAARYLLEKQLPGGGWSMYPGGRIEISGSVKAYFALKLTGHDPQSYEMRQARQVILDHGGADAVNSFTRFYLALLGQIPYDLCPAVPPEMVLLPRWAPMHIYAISAWSRTIFVPLSIVSALQPVRQIESEQGIEELFLREPRHWPPLRRPGAPEKEPLWSWDRFFRTVDAALQGCQRRGVLPLRRRALAAAEQWMLERFDGSDGLGAIFPPIIWSVIALRSLGYSDDSEPLKACYRELDALVLEDPTSGSIRLQPCKSPVWDTAITMRALQQSGFPSASAQAGKAAAWLADRQILRRGDWSETVRAEPGGWCFEYHNDFYPDNDDTAMVLMALRRWFESSGAQQDSAGSGSSRTDGETAGKQRHLGAMPDVIRRGMEWLLAMQNDDGGWGAFDRNNNRQFLCSVPFADHNAMIDPSTPDLTARALECLGQLGLRQGHSVVDRAIAFLRRSQESDGSWYGRWGVNYIYGTWQVLTGLADAGLPQDDPAVEAGVDWLLRHQQSSGGWGESADSYEAPGLRGQGPVTPSQTAWALLGLLAAGRRNEPAVERGIRYLVETQRPDGTWDEPQFTGTGFPRVFYLRYHYYRIDFPLMALGRWLQGS